MDQKEFENLKLELKISTELLESIIDNLYDIYFDVIDDWNYNDFKLYVNKELQKRND